MGAKCLLFLHYQGFRVCFYLLDVILKAPETSTCYPSSQLTLDYEVEKKSIIVFSTFCYYNGGCWQEIELGVIYMHSNKSCFLCTFRLWNKSHLKATVRSFETTGRKQNHVSIACG